MALRKFKSPMKVVSIIIIVVMSLSVGYAGYNFVIDYFEGQKAAFTVNGIKKTESSFNNNLLVNKSTLLSQLDQNRKSSGSQNTEEIFSDDLVKQFTMIETINLLNLENLMKVYKVSADKNKVAQIYNSYVDQVGGESKLALYLQQSGMTLKDFRKDISVQVAKEALANKIKEGIEVSDKDLQVVYEAYKATDFENKSFEEVKKQVKDKYLNSNVVLDSVQKNITNVDTISFHDESLKNLFVKLEEVVNEKYNLTLHDVLPYAIQFLLSDMKYEDAIDRATKLYVEQLDKMNQYKDKVDSLGITLPKEIVSPYSYQEYMIISQADFIRKYEVSDEKLLETFNKRKSSLDKPETYSGLILEYNFTPSEADKKAALDKANEILKELNHDNFSELANKYSADKASKDGNLGKQDITRYVTEFKNALIEHEKGEIFGPIETEYGYHLIEILDKDAENPNLVDAKHILIPIEVSAETKEKEKTEFFKLKDKLEKGKITAKNSTNYSSFISSAIPFENLTKDGYIPTLGYVSQITNEISTMQVASVSELVLENSAYLIKKQSQDPAKEATFEEYKDQIRQQLAEVEFRIQ